MFTEFLVKPKNIGKTQLDFVVLPRLYLVVSICYPLLELLKTCGQTKETEKPKQSDNFTNLSPKSQNLVTRICQMGFPKERVINIVGKLGEKEKEVSIICQYFLLVIFCFF